MEVLSCGRKVLQRSKVIQRAEHLCCAGMMRSAVKMLFRVCYDMYGVEILCGGGRMFRQEILNMVCSSYTESYFIDLSLGC